MNGQDDREGKEPLVAAALKYDPETDDAPVVLGVGRGVAASNMVRNAQEENIPVVEDQELAGLLAKLSAGDEIPEELYRVVSEVLVFLCTLDTEYGKRFGLMKGEKR